MSYGTVLIIIPMVVIVIYTGWLMYDSDRYISRLADRSLPVCR